MPKRFPSSLDTNVNNHVTSTYLFICFQQLAPLSSKDDDDNDVDAFGAYVSFSLYLLYQQYTHKKGRTNEKSYKLEL